MARTSGARSSSFNDRATRSLNALQKSASTSRVLNLARVEAGHRDSPEYISKPFFRNRVLNSALIIKHRLRGDEYYLFNDGRQSSTKVIIPFSANDLSLGGQSFFVDQDGWLDILHDICPDRADLTQAVDILRHLEELPSLDPFLLKEHLKRHGYDIAPCYFAITEADFERMQAYVASQVAKLIALAYKNIDEVDVASTGRLVEALLSTHVDARLDPLRKTLMLEGDEFSEGVFCWKGFLYYKWVLSNATSEIKDIIGEIRNIAVTGPRDYELNRYIDAARERIQQSILAQRREVVNALQVYDVAFNDLTANGNPTSFREFLLKAPQMFISLGDKIGGLSHILSFWRYRFPKGRPPISTVDEVVSIFQDFEASLSVNARD